MATRSSGKQGVGVYFVCPLSSAVFAASLINAGVSKSGSPAPNPTTSIPAFFIALALALTASVIESATTFTRSAKGIMGSGAPETGEKNLCNPYFRNNRGPQTVSPSRGDFKQRGDFNERAACTDRI